MGYSPPSEPIEILTAVIPDAPTGVQTEVIANDIRISWTAPSEDSQTDYGSQIVSYTILIQAADGESFFQESNHCDGSETGVIASTECHVPISVLLGSPFLLTESVYAKVAATNVIGDSIFSSVGNGALIALSFPPDAPVDLTRNEEKTSLTVLAFSWSDGASNGGQPILDYRVSFDQGINSWVVLSSSVTTKLVEIGGATPSKTYQFKIEARNVIGYSAESAAFSIKAAVIPGAPTSVVTSRDLNNVVIEWAAPSTDELADYGDLILGYNIYIKTVEQTWEQDLVSCPGNDPSVFACAMTIIDLQNEPFRLQDNDSVFVKVVAYNSIGEGPESLEGNGAIISTVVEPDSPVDLQRDNGATTISSVGFTWSDGASDGGSPVIDYRVSYD